jgi:hypothetical protein
VLKYGVDDLLLETGWLPDAPEADNYSTLRASAYVLWQPTREWEFRAGARLDGMYQNGGLADHDELLADYTETYARYRSGDTRLTFGAQTIIWGRADEIPLADRVSRVDLTRFILDDLADRRRAQLAARWEQTFGDYKLDAVYLPVFRGAQLPDYASVWSPVNRTTGRVLGIDPALTGWVTGATAIDEDEHGSGGGGLRLTRAGAALRFRRDAVAHPPVDALLPGRLCQQPADRDPSLQHLRRRGHGDRHRRTDLAHGARLDR